MKGFKGNRRSVVLINPRFQLAFIAYMLALTALVMSTVYFSNYWFFRIITEEVNSMSLPANHIFFQYIAEQRQTMNTIFTVTFITCFTVLFIGGLFMSHRIAGPLKRLQGHLQGLIKGEVKGELNFREHDFFPEVAEDLNKYIRFKDGGPAA